MKRILVFILTACMLVSLCACGTDIPQGEATVTDLVGRTVSVTPGSYRRVVCIGAGALRMYCYIGDVANLAAVEDIDNESLSQRPQMFDSVARPYMLAFGHSFESLPSCGVGGPMAQAPDVEKILACNPDIIISEFEDAEVAANLQQQTGVPVITLSSGKDGVFDAVFADSMKLLGKVFDKEDKAEALISFIADEKAAIEARVKDIPEEEKPSVYICGLGNWGTTNHLMTAEDYVSFRIAGVKNVVSGLGMTGVGPIEAEKFLALSEQMDILIMDAAAVKNIKPLYAEDPSMFDTCKAWNDGEVYLEMAYNAYYTNYEIALANTWFIAKTVYPEAFADIDLTEKTNEITKAFLGTELAERIFACPGSFGGYGKIDTADFFG